MKKRKLKAQLAGALAELERCASDYKILVSGYKALNYDYDALREKHNKLAEELADVIKERDTNKRDRDPWYHMHKGLQSLLAGKAPPQEGPREG